MSMSYSNLRCLGWICVVDDACARLIGELIKSRIQINKTGHLGNIKLSHGKSTFI